MRVRTLLVSATVASVPLIAGGVTLASTMTTTLSSNSTPAVAITTAQNNALDVGTQVLQNVQQGLQQQVGQILQSGGPDTKETGVPSEAAG